MKITKEQYLEIRNRLQELETQINGGKGSGNFGHAGRPGKVGGSAKESGGIGSDESRKRGARRYRDNDFAHKDMAYVVRAVRKGQNVTLQDVENEPAIKEAFEKSKFDKDTLQEHEGDAEREKLQEKLTSRLLNNENGAFSGKKDHKDQFNGKVEQGKEAYIVIGPPAGGKSSVFANPLSREHGARIIDSDKVKEWLPEFNNGLGAGRVQAESDKIMNAALKKATDRGENIVIPKIGGESVAQIARDLKAKGYKVHLKFNEVAPETSVSRAISRFVETGRWLDPNYLMSIGDKPKKFYEKYSKNKELFDTAEWLNNDVKFGQKPKKIDRVN